MNGPAVNPKRYFVIENPKTHKRYLDLPTQVHRVLPGLQSKSLVVVYDEKDISGWEWMTLEEFEKSWSPLVDQPGYAARRSQTYKAV